MEHLSTDDYVAIQQLYARYSFALDLRDVDAYLGCWTEDGEMHTFIPPGPARSRKGNQARREGFRASREDPRNDGYHWTSNVLIDAAEHGANGKSCLMYLHAPGGRGEVGIALYYRDELVKRDGRWLFQRRVLGPLGWEPRREAPDAGALDAVGVVEHRPTTGGSPE